MFRAALIGLSALALAACEPAASPAPQPDPSPAGDQAALEAEAADQAAYDAAANTPPTDPVANIEWRAERCAFSGTEIRGDRSQADRDTQARMAEWRCGDALSAEGAALKTANASDAAIVARIDAALRVANGD